MADHKVIVGVAPTAGMAQKSQDPHLPTQPLEIAEMVARCAELGASNDEEGRRAWPSIG